MNNIKEYKEHIVAFIDLIGFKHAVDSEKENEVLDLLRTFSKFARNAFQNITKNGTGEETITIWPAISIFSDSIIISIPIDASIPKEIIIPSLNQWIAKFAFLALEKGFLIRGGVAKGTHYHNDDEHIVFGKAYLKSQKLESELANYPRVIVSKEVYNFFSSNENIFLHDFDGMITLNYIGAGFGLIRAGILHDQSHRNIKNTISIFDKIISENIAKLTLLDDKAKELSKWTWFNQHYTKIKNSEEEQLEKIK